MKLTHNKKILLLIITSIVLAVGLDMAIGRSVYHPLKYLYQILSWASCRSFRCHLMATEAVKGQKGMVVTSHAEASRVGQEILLSGGNAIDAAVAVGYALAVVEPCCGNIGGGGFMVIQKANGEEIFLNFREKAPLAARPNMYLNQKGEVVPKLSTQGYLAVGVPGTVAVTYTINSLFGAKVIAKDTGFFLNNEMDDFTAKPGKANQFGLVQGQANQIEPGKQPLSSMSPTIVKKGDKVILVTGSPGGATIPTTVVQVITNSIDYKLDIAQAVNAPRIHYQGLPNWVLTEPFALAPEVVPRLWEKGYRVIPFISWGAAESILIEPETSLLLGVNDRRRVAGKAIGY